MIVALLLALGTAAVPVAGADRLIRCELGYVQNVGARTAAELVIVGKHRIAVLQPAAAVYRGKGSANGPAAAKLLRVHDPDRVLAVRTPDFLLDGWPERLELLATLPDDGRAFLSLGSIVPGAGTATGSAGLIAPDGVTMAADRFLQGPCTVETGPGLAAKFEGIR